MEEEKELILDILTVMKGLDLDRIKISIPQSRTNTMLKEIGLPTRIENAIRRHNDHFDRKPGRKGKGERKISSVKDLMEGLQDGYLRKWEAIGITSIADCKHAILLWHISENYSHGEAPLTGIQIE